MGEQTAIHFCGGSNAAFTTKAGVRVREDSGIMITLYHCVQKVMQGCCQSTGKGAVILCFCDRWNVDHFSLFSLFSAYIYQKLNILKLCNKELGPQTAKLAMSICLKIHMVELA